MKRKPVIGGNWKMYKTKQESLQFISEFKTQVTNVQDKVDIVILPAFPLIPTVADALQGTNISVGAQNMHFEDRGAFTGEVSPVMLLDAGATHVVLGHSERRKIFGETDELIAKKVKTAHGKGLIPIVCIGETRAERESGDMKRVLETQVHGSLQSVSLDEMKNTILAYEPVWAIGTGLTATPAQAQEAHQFVRCLLETTFGTTVASMVRIQYGGSMKPENAKELFSQPDIDGGLVGGASLEPGSLAQIVRSAVD